MAGEALDSADVGWNGLAGDRRWAFIRPDMERSGFPWLTIRERPTMWKYQPRFLEADKPDTSAVVVRTPEGIEYDVDDPALAEELGVRVRVIKQNRGVFDTFPVALISMQTISALGVLAGMSLDPRRFRPNLLVDTGDTAGFAEDEWVGAVLRIGTLRLRVDKRDGRCVVTNVDPETTERDPVVLRTIARERGGQLGVYGTVVSPGRVSVGDRIVVEK